MFDICDSGVQGLKTYKIKDKNSVAIFHSIASTIQQTWKCNFSVTDPECSGLYILVTIFRSVFSSKGKFHFNRNRSIFTC